VLLRKGYETGSRELGTRWQVGAGAGADAGEQLRGRHYSAGYDFNAVPITLRSEIV